MLLLLKLLLLLNCHGIWLILWLLKIGSRSLLLTDSLLDKLSEPLYRYVTFTCARLLVCQEPGHDIFVSIESALLISHIIACTTLLVKLGQAVRSLLKRIFQGDQMKLGRHHCRWYISLWSRNILVLIVRWMLLLLVIIVVFFLLGGSSGRSCRERLVILQRIEVGRLLLLILAWGATVLILFLLRVHNYYSLFIKFFFYFCIKTFNIMGFWGFGVLLFDYYYDY